MPQQRPPPAPDSSLPNALIAYRYYIVENAFPARADADKLEADTLRPDGTWHPTDYLKTVEGGREVTQHQADSYWQQQKEHGLI